MVESGEEEKLKGVQISWVLIKEKERDIEYFLKIKKKSNYENAY